MKKYFYLAAVSAMMLTACSSEQDVVQPTPEPSTPTVAVQQQAVTFDTYVPAAAAGTRTAPTGVMTTGTLQSSGFGVFAQYSNNTNTADGAYSKDANPVANFMFNQEVTYASAAWGYTPLKYWPNETKSDNQGATSEYADKLSFFAYAPYVSSGETSITGMITNDATGADPWVSYSVATTPDNSVDLLWGVAPTGGLSYVDVTGGTTTVPKGMPLVNLIKPKKDEKIKFLFQHALARLGLTIVAAVDQISAGGELSATTKIAVESVVISETTNDGGTPTPTATPKLFEKGTLNLKNTTEFQSLWTTAAADAFTNFTISGTTMNPAIKFVTDGPTTYGTDGFTGVTTTEQKVIAQSGTPLHDNYFMVIPSHADTELQVVITYYVITKDTSLKDGYSTVQNVITKKVTIPGLTNNKAYNLKLILGLTSVKLDAEVADWKVDGSTEVYLPANAQ